MSVYTCKYVRKAGCMWSMCVLSAPCTFMYVFMYMYVYACLYRFRFDLALRHRQHDVKIIIANVTDWCHVRINLE